MNLKNKRGAELTVGTIVIVVLAVLVLVILIVGFTSGWESLWANVTSFFGGGANIDTVKSACATACTTGSVDAYCVQKRDVKYTNPKTGEIDKTTLKGKTCKELETTIPSASEACGSIPCPAVAVARTCTESGGTCVDTSATGGNCPSGQTMQQLTGCTGTQICCKA